jgi:hypothetical protein
MAAAGLDCAAKQPAREFQYIMKLSGWLSGALLQVADDYNGRSAAGTFTSEFSASINPQEAVD